MMLALLASSATTLNTAATVFAILGSAVLVLAGISALVRSIWKVASTLRDNTRATADLSGKMTNLSGKLDNFAETMDGRVAILESRVAALEHPASP